MGTTSNKWDKRGISPDDKHAERERNIGRGPTSLSIAPLLVEPELNLLRFEVVTHFLWIQDNYFSPHTCTPQTQILVLLAAVL